MAERKLWPALVVRGGASTDPSSSNEIAELLSAALDEFSPTGVHDLASIPVPPGGLWDPTYPPPPDPPLAPVEWRVFFASAVDRDAAVAALSVGFPGVVIAVEDVIDEDWAARSQRQLTAIRAGRFIVAPPWDVPPIGDDATLVVIEPSRGFGTGHHASTRLCLRALSEVDVRGARVLDLGTGSGVLAMAAARHGARAVLAVDVDPDAIAAAHASAALNQKVDAIEWVITDFRMRSESSLAGPWDLVLANLTGGMLISSSRRIRELVGRGVLIASGFDEAERESVVQALELTPRTMLVEEGWVGLTLSAEC